MISAVLITVFTRDEHFIRCVESLQRCILANKTHLFIASDEGRTDQEKAKVRKIRNHSQGLKTFKSVTILKRPHNVGQPSNSFLAFKEILCDHDRLIILEDDVVVGKYFLEFLNNGLTKYYDDENICGVCAHLPPQIDNLKKKPFLGHLKKINK